MNNRGSKRNTNVKKKGNYKKGSSSKCSKFQNEREGSEDLKSKTNDPNWYAANPAIMRDAASIPFSWAVGTPITMNMDTTGLSATSEKDFFVPGIQVMVLKPSVGWSPNATSPINIASTAMYSFVRHANSGHSNYDSPDLMLYTLAMSQVYSAINWLMRIYGCATLYAQRNRYLPTALLEAQGVDAKDVMNHLADFRYGINVLISKAASLAVPASMTIFQRHAFLYQNVYTEGTSIKDQLYMYNPGMFWMYGLKPTDSSGTLVPKAVGDKLTVDGLLQLVDDLLTPIISSEDMNIMSGDILKAYGDGGIIKLQNLNEVYPITPIFDIAVLEQMKNATVVLASSNSLSVEQDATHGYLVSRPAYYGDATIADATTKTNMMRRWSENRILTTTTAEVDPSLVMESTRLMVGGTYAAKNGDVVEQVQLACGTEVCTQVVWYYYEWNPLTGHEGEVRLVNRALSAMEFLDQTYWKAPTSKDFTTALAKASIMSHFRFHPCMRVWITNGDTDKSVYLYGTLFDVDNYAVIHGDTLQRLHEAALMNMLAVPSIARL